MKQKSVCRITNIQNIGERFVGVVSLICKLVMKLEFPFHLFYSLWGQQHQSGDGGDNDGLTAFDRLIFRCILSECTQWKEGPRIVLVGLQT